MQSVELIYSEGQADQRHHAVYTLVLKPDKTFINRIIRIRIQKLKFHGIFDASGLT